jgi:hypothetical protein
MAVRITGGDPFPRKDIFLAWVGGFLPVLERTIDKYMK